MNLNGTRFGQIDYTEDDVVVFEEGLIGFARCREYVLLSTKEGSPFRWLQSVEDPCLAFLVVDPHYYVDSYAPAIEDFEAVKLGIDRDTPCVVYTTAAIPAGSPSDMTINLAAPIVINPTSRKAKQLVIEDPAYTIKHRVFPAANRTEEKQAA